MKTHHALAVTAVLTFALTACGTEAKETTAPQAPTSQAPTSQTPTSQAPVETDHSHPDLSSFPLETGFNRDDADYKQKPLDKPSEYAPCGVEPWSPDPVAWRGVELAGPEDHASREVLVFDTEATATKALDDLQAMVCPSTPTEGEQTAFHTAERADVGGRDTLTVAGWYQVGDRLTPGIEGVSVSRAGRAVLVLRHYTEGAGRADAEQLAQDDLGDVERLLMALGEI